MDDGVHIWSYTDIVISCVIQRDILLVFNLGYIWLIAYMMSDDSTY